MEIQASAVFDREAICIFRKVEFAVNTKFDGEHTHALTNSCSFVRGICY